MIPLGYELGTGRRVNVPLGHMIVLGQTQKSGKTTTLEALAARSGKTLIAFITKRGEKSFRLSHAIPPFYSETSETQPYWKFVVSLIESMQDVRLGFRERGWVMELCTESGIEKSETDAKGKKKRVKHSWKEPRTLESVLANAELALEHSKGANRMICRQLVEYLRIAVPEIKRAKLSSAIELRRGINVMDIAKLSSDVQALIVRSVVEYVYANLKNTIVIIPEAWKFLPEGHDTPVIEPVRSLIRQGAVIGNFVWIDLQDLRGIRKEIVRSIGVWLFGVQREKNEIENTLKSMPVPQEKPTATDMMSLRIGQFIATYDTDLYRVYVQPAGMEDAHAQAIARGEERPESWPQILRSLDEEAKEAAHRDVGGADHGAGVHGDSAELASGEEVGGDSGEAAEGGELRAGVAGMEGEDDVSKETIKALAEKLACDADDLSVVTAVGRLVDAHDGLAKRLEILEGKSSPSQASTQRSAETAGAAVSSHDSPVAAAPVSNGHVDLDARIRAVFTRMATEDPATVKTLAQLFQSSPELQVKRVVRTVQMQDSTTQGRLALLLHEGFFDTEQDTGDITREFKRRGWFESKTSNAAVLKPIAQLTEWGFFTREDSGYRAVAGMKVNVTEVSA